jgi:hypothetical protein
VEKNIKNAVVKRLLKRAKKTNISGSEILNSPILN